MGLKEIFKKSFEDKENLIYKRLKASKFIFMIISFLFFLNFFFVGGGFYNEYFIVTFGYIYFLFFISLFFYSFFFIKGLFLKEVSRSLYVFIFILLLLLFGLLSLPLVLEGGLGTIVDFIKLYINF